MCVYNVFYKASCRGTTLRLTKGAVARAVIVLLLPSLPIYTTPIKHLTKASTMPHPRQPRAPLPAPHIRLELRLRPCQPHTATACTRPRQPRTLA